MTELTVKAVTSFDDLLQVVAVRAAVFIGELGSPYAEEIDGNDFAGNHILAKLGDEPVGTMRIRWYSDFAFMERLAVRREFRSYGTFMGLARFALDFCRQKGFRRVHGYSEPSAVALWKRLGIGPIDGMPPVRIGAHEYVPLLGELAAHEAAVTMGRGVEVLTAPEGLWPAPTPACRIAAE